MSAQGGGAEVPMVSVIMPAFNAERYVAEALTSVLSQGCADLEIVLVDDGSQDATVACAQAVAPQARILRQANAGVAAARNAGLAAARGRFICFLDADDLWLPGKLAAQLAHLHRHPETGLVYHRWHVWRPDAHGRHAPPVLAAEDEPAGLDEALSGWIYPRLLLDCVVHTSTVMIRREIAAAAGFFDTALVLGEDYDYWLRVSRLCRIDKLAATYSCYRAVAGSLSSRPRAVNYEYRVIAAALARWGRRAPDGSELPDVLVRARLARLAMDFGYSHHRHGSPELAWRAYLTALRHEPWHWRALAWLAAARLKALLPGGR